MRDETESIIESANLVLEEFHSHVSGCAEDRHGLIHIDVEVPAYIYGSTYEKEYLTNLIEKHLKIAHGLQSEDLLICLYPRKHQGDLDDYIKRNY